MSWQDRLKEKATKVYGEPVYTEKFIIPFITKLLKEQREICDREYDTERHKQGLEHSIYISRAIRNAPEPE